MAQRLLELTLISAKNLKEVTVNLFSKMKVCAVVSLSGDPRSQHCITADRTPTWNATLCFTVPASGAGSLHVLLRAKRALRYRDVGEVHIPLSELLSGAPDGPVPVKSVAYQVREISSGNTQGVLSLSYKLGEVTAQAAYAQPTPAAAYPPPSGYPPAGMPTMTGEPVTSYPAAAGPSTATPYAVPPPQYGYGYPAQQWVGLGYPTPPPPQSCYGYPQQAVKPSKKNNFVRLLPEVTRRFASEFLGEMASDASAHDASNDGGAFHLPPLSLSFPGVYTYYHPDVSVLVNI